MRSASHFGTITKTFVALAGALLLALVLLAQSALGGPGSWSRLDLNGIRVNVVAPDPNAPNVLFAGTFGQGIFRSADGGQNWAQVNTGLGNLTVNDLLIDPTNTNNILAATGRGSLVGEPGSGIYRSTDRGGTWALAQATGATFALALTSQSPNVVYAGGGPPVFKSTDGGATWSQSFQSGTDIVNVEIRGISVDPADPNILLAGGNTEGGQGQLFRSTNAGSSWDRVLAGQQAILDLRFVTDLRAGVIAFFGGLGGVLRSTDAGLTWQQATGVPAGIDVRRIGPNPLNGNEVAVATGAGVFTSTDAGMTFGQLDSTLGNLSVRGVAYNRAAPQTLYAGTDDGVWAFTFTPSPTPSPTASPTPVVPTPTPAPAAAATFFFAEGSSQPPFDSWFLVQNATSNAAAVRFTFQLEDATTRVFSFTVGPTTRFSLFANQILPNLAFSTRVDSDQPIAVERSLFVGFDGSAVPGIPGPARSWLFAEGVTADPFQTWLLIQNPNSVSANTTITYLLRDQPPVVQALGALAPNSRTSIFVNQVLPNQEFGVRVDSDQPVIVEESTFRFPGNAATTVAGANMASTNWFFAEGSSVQSPPGPVDTFLLLENPQQIAANRISVTLFGTNGGQTAFQISMPPNSRRTIFLNDFLPNSSFGIRVSSDQPIVAERSEFFGPEPRGATATVGATSLATQWNLAEGSTQPPFQTSISVLNPNSDPTSVRMDFQLENGQVVTQNFAAGANSKLTVNVGDFLANNAFSTKVTTSQPTVVERLMFLNKLGSIGETDAVGTASR
jgi:photosystem II stability/assembly factor-like uncharacterized protein